MLECWKKALGNRKIAGALLTDLSKAFDCLNHGFHHSAHTFIFSYLSDRKQHTKVNNFSAHGLISTCKTGINYGSIYF